jgi:hypothetical protein
VQQAELTHYEEYALRSGSHGTKQGRFVSMHRGDVAATVAHARALPTHCGLRCPQGVGDRCRNVQLRCGSVSVRSSQKLCSSYRMPNIRGLAAMATGLNKCRAVGCFRLDSRIEMNWNVHETSTPLASETLRMCERKLVTCRTAVSALASFPRGCEGP